MTRTARSQRTYDHRLKELVYSTGDIQIAIEQGVPRSTAKGWLTSPPAEVVSVDALDLTVDELRRELFVLRKRNRELFALLRLFVVLVRVSGFSLAKCRLPEGWKKRAILKAVKTASRALPMSVVLRVLRLSPRRYHTWRRSDVACELDDMLSCPRTSPHQLTLDEMRVVKEMVTSDEYRHVPTGTLAILAQRLGRVFASPTTWYRLVRVHRWRRPRGRVHPAKPKVGIRASRPNEIWHVDTTVIRLIDGTRAYLHGVIDNFSRRILAWHVTERFDPTSTVEILNAATLNVQPGDGRPDLIVDGGPENYNPGVNDLVESGRLRRLLALTEVIFSNSMIESWWRVLKHQWLFLNTLDSAASVRKLVEFYVDEHNTKLPHNAFRGQTPDEMYFGTGGDIPDELEAAKNHARQERFELNRQAACGNCEEGWGAATKAS